MSHERPARLFVAGELPVTVAEDLASWARDVAGSDPALRRVAPGSLHLTLAFLGATPPADVPVLGRALGAAVGGAAWPGGLAFEDVLWLPRGRPGVLAARVDDPDGTLAPLRAAVAGALVEAVGWEPEARPFLAHVTVARVRRGQRPRTLELPWPSPEPFALEAVTLFGSAPGEEGPVYTPLARVVRP